MTIYFGENLKKLRKEQELTQETLADFLGVSFQAVSKWERGETYPDITILPAISSFFGVSVDDLIGVSKTNNDKKINEYLELYDNMKNEDISSVFKKFQTARKEFPREFRILVRYMELLTAEKDSVYSPEYVKTSHELMSIYENIQKHCTDDSIRIWSKRIICNHLLRKYDCTRPHEEKYLLQAEKIINELPTMSNSKEYMSLSLIRDISKHYSTHESTAEELLYLLQNTIISYCYYDKTFSAQYKIKIINSVQELFYSFYTDGNYGKNWLHIIYNYGHLGHLYFENGDKDNAIKNLRICAEQAKRLDEQPDTFKTVSRFYETEKSFREKGMCERMKILMAKHYPLTEEFKSTPEFEEIICLLNN